MQDSTQQFLNVEDPAGTNLHACLSPNQIWNLFPKSGLLSSSYSTVLFGNEYHDDAGTGSSTF